MKQKPIIAITMGDPAGVGPEIITKALTHREVFDVARPLVIGDAAILEKAAQLQHLDVAIHTVAEPADGHYTLGQIDCIDLAMVDMATFQYGQIQAQCGKAAYAYIEKAVSLALDKKVAALATAPLNKESFKAGKVPYIGHTEVLEALTDTKNPLTMFEVRNLRAFFLTRHVPLKEACELINEEMVLDFLGVCSKTLQGLGIAKPYFAIAGLNPHAGEHGLFGREEVDYIAPAVAKARQQGIDITGPIGADSVFYQALQGRYDAVVSLYHDQGHIATKMVDFERTIAVTNNLPFMRTSVDHGTAFDIAGKGIVSEISMVEAIKVAAKYC